MKKTVWVIEQGSYSDYRVVGVFESEADAQFVSDAINAPDEYKYVGDEATVSEWPLNPAVTELRKGYKPFIVQMESDGSVLRCEPWHVQSYELSGEVNIWRRSKAPAFVGQGLADVLQATIWARDGKHAVKIANEHRARLIAAGEWDTEARS